MCMRLIIPCMQHFALFPSLHVQYHRKQQKKKACHYYCLQACKLDIGHAKDAQSSGCEQIFLLYNSHIQDPVEDVVTCIEQCIGVHTLMMCKINHHCTLLVCGTHLCDILSEVMEPNIHVCKMRRCLIRNDNCSRHEKKVY